MIAARQELELRPALERLDRVIAASEGIEPDTLTFAFRPLWQLDAASAATIALQKAQATQVYAGLSLWPKATMARLVQAQLAEDGTYPNANMVFAKDAIISDQANPVSDYNPDQPRDPDGRWTLGINGTVPSPFGAELSHSIGTVATEGPQTVVPPLSAGGAGKATSSFAQRILPNFFFEDPPVVPDPGIPYPSDPTLPPSPDYVWKGPPGSQPGDPKGSWYNEKTGESLHPDFNHEPGVDPHYDYQFRGSKRKGWRWFPGAMVPKT